MTNIYVGNLPPELTTAELEEAFAGHGTVNRAQIITDRTTGQSRGFGFVEMPNDAEGQAAIKALDGSELAGRVLTVNVARPKTDRRNRGGGGGSGRGRRW